MDELFLKQVYNFVDEFDSIYSSNKYISKKIVDDFYDKYSDIVAIVNKYPNYDDDKYKKFIIIVKHGYEIITKRNEKYIEFKLKEEKDYFDNLFKDVDPKIVLDNEQRKAIIIDEDYSLIVAGAGSGKTTTMAAKVKYLVERRHVDPNSIILLSFTNASVDDLDDLINNKFKLGIEILTFHKLGMKFLRNTFQQSFEIIADAGAYKVISEYFLENVFKNKELLKKYMKAFDSFLYLEEDCLEYTDYDSYFQNYMDKKYEECKNNLDEEIKKRVKNRSRHLKTINGEYVKSEGEFNIANYLYKQGIKYHYEAKYPFSISGNRSYHPDFTVDNFDTPLYIEYYGLATLNKNGEPSSDDEKYLSEIYKKRDTHKKNKTDLLELFSRYDDGNYYMPTLSYELTNRNIIRNPRSQKEIFYRILETGKEHKYTKLIKLFRIFINLFKEKNYVYDDFDELITKCTNDDVKEQLKLLKDVFAYYQEYIHSRGKIDFQDMIHYAYTNMEKLKENRKSLKYDYVVIDEYQDVSYQRYRFARKISDVFDSKIVAVGDDWQTIYSFSGSDIDLFTNFIETMGYGEEVQITNTYRNSQELIDLAGDFVLKNENQIEKKLHSNKHLSKPVRIVQYHYDETDDDLPQELDKLLNKIYSSHPDDKILLLSRFNMELDYLIDSKLFYKPNLSDNSVICKSIPEAKIDFLTVHKSKGLGYDRVIILNGINSTYGFPSQVEDQPIIKYIKGEYNIDIEVSDAIEYPEERRLFYVALTRTKNELYIMTPYIYKYRSSFVKEIESNENVMIENN